jgi:TctA family transporter
MMRFVELTLEKYWKLLLAGAIVLALFSGCAISRHIDDTTGQEVAIIELDEGPAADVIDAIGGDGASEALITAIEDATGVDPEAAVSAAIEETAKAAPKIAEDVSEGDILGTVLGIFGALVGIFGGYKVRKRLNAKKNAAKKKNPVEVNK